MKISLHMIRSFIHNVDVGIMIYFRMILHDTFCQIYRCKMSDLIMVTRCLCIHRIGFWICGINWSYVDHLLSQFLCFRCSFDCYPSLYSFESICLFGTGVFQLLFQSRWLAANYCPSVDFLSFLFLFLVLNTSNRFVS